MHFQVFRDFAVIKCYKVITRVKEGERSYTSLADRLILSEIAA
jgi:hypothetical protein